MVSVLATSLGAGGADALSIQAPESALIKMALVLVSVILLLLALRGKSARAKKTGPFQIELHDLVKLSARQQLLVVGWAGRYTLLASGENGFTRIDSRDALESLEQIHSSSDHSASRFALKEAKRV